MNTPRETYQGRLRIRSDALRGLRRRDHALSIVLLGLGVGFVLLFWLDIGHGVLRLSWTLPLGIWVLSFGYRQTVRRLACQTQRSVTFYLRGLARLDGELLVQEKAYVPIIDKDHWSQELEIFGPNSLFQSLSGALTRAGEVTLGQWLTTPASVEELLRRQRAVVELRNSIDMREDLEILGAELADTASTDELERWVRLPPLRIARWSRLIALFLASLNIFCVTWYCFYDGSVWLPTIVLSTVCGFNFCYRRFFRNAAEVSRCRLAELEVISRVLA